MSGAPPAASFLARMLTGALSSSGSPRRLPAGAGNLRGMRNFKQRKSPRDDRDPGPGRDWRGHEAATATPGPDPTPPAEKARSHAVGTQRALGGTSASHPGSGHCRPQPTVGVIQAGARRGGFEP